MYSQHTRLKAVEMRRAGHSVASIVQQLGISEGTVCAIMRENGLAGRRAAPRRSKRKSQLLDIESLVRQYGRVEIDHYGTAGQPGSGFVVVIGSQRGYGATIEAARLSAIRKHEGAA